MNDRARRHLVLGVGGHHQIALFALDHRALRDQEDAALLAGEQADAQYTDRIVLSIIVPQEQSQKFKSRIIETFNATVTPRQTGTSNRPVRY